MGAFNGSKLSLHHFSCKITVNLSIRCQRCIVKIRKQLKLYGLRGRLRKGGVANFMATKCGFWSSFLCKLWAQVLRTGCNLLFVYGSILRFTLDVGGW